MAKSLKEQKKDELKILELEIEATIERFEEKTGFMVQRILRKNPSTIGQSKIMVVTD